MFVNARSPTKQLLFVVLYLEQLQTPVALTEYAFCFLVGCLVRRLPCFPYRPATGRGTAVAWASPMVDDWRLTLYTQHTS